MQIGDKVSVVHGLEKGHVVRVLKNDLIEIETEDGFVLPFNKSELVLVEEGGGSSANKAVRTDKSSDKEWQKEAKGKGIYLGFEQRFQQAYALWFENQETTEILLSLAWVDQEKEHWKGFFAALLMPGQQIDVQEILPVEDLDAGKVLGVQVLYHPSGPVDKPLIRALKIKQKWFSKVTNNAFSSKKPGFWIQVQADPTIRFAEESSDSKVVKIAKAPELVDLHIEVLLDDFESMASSEILAHQLVVFQNALDRAIAAGNKEITFIHGVGNGILRHEIHKKLAKNEHIKYFEDAQKEKFGFGATKVGL